ncbi:S-formylglutathione hydrolase [Pleionea litopenaei]|uniref:S-formylglutathione hydrolase n=1 Tax=Pleionea litopenaei TaxID=3070815 RepID=A0AA51X7U2_9GAMM|nr:S-formylglutathione hydrolase [Pleionea sp. HL-JVS1]WMS87460.1 S-formylglutathione hydrolase [Pleionea sp. HL-JVS1]
MQVIESNKCHDGYWKRFKHQSTACQSEMTFSVFFPKGYAADVSINQFSLHDSNLSYPTLFWLSGLTCTDQNFVQKAHVEKAANQWNMLIVAPDTSPRDAGLAGEEDDYDFGTGAGFYLDATKQPWSEHYNMHRYVSEELYQLITQTLPVATEQMGIFGHSMGGHGALTIALKHPDKFKSVSAFAPICQPTQCDWGKKAFAGYLDDIADATMYDACALIEQGKRVSALLVDQGTEDNFYPDQLRTESLVEHCDKFNIPATIRMQPGYDHSYFFIATFIEEHIAFHAQQLGV